jgi:hypothetical protein
MNIYDEIAQIEENLRHEKREIHIRDVNGKDHIITDGDLNPICMMTVHEKITKQEVQQCFEKIRKKIIEQNRGLDARFSAQKIPGFSHDVVDKGTVSLICAQSTTKEKEKDSKKTPSPPSTSQACFSSSPSLPEWCAQSLIGCNFSSFQRYKINSINENVRTNVQLGRVRSSNAYALRKLATSFFHCTLHTPKPFHNTGVVCYSTQNDCHENEGAPQPHQ